MSSRQPLVLCFIFLTVLQGSGHCSKTGLRCFSCKHEGELDHWCMKEPFDKKANADKAVKCRKKELCGVTTYDEYSVESGDWEPVVERSCIKDCDDAEEKFEDSFARRLRHFRCEVCDKDLCNGTSPYNQPQIFLYVLTVTLSLIYFL